MRFRTAPMLALALLLGTALVVTTRRAEGQNADEGRDRITVLEQKLVLLSTDVEFLRRRERATTEYLLALGKASANLHAMTQAARVAGFEMAAIPANARIEVLRGIDQLGADLSAGLPAPTREDMALQRKADDLRRALK
jgi:hypothetical protein